MTTMVVQIKVNDFVEWKKVFDANSGFRALNGEISHQIYTDASDSNKVTTIFKWDSLPKAQNFSQSQELKEAMMEAGVQGPPTVYFLNEAKA